LNYFYETTITFIFQRIFKSIVQLVRTISNQSSINRPYFIRCLYYCDCLGCKAVEPKSPSMVAGLCVGDIITHVNSTSVIGVPHIELLRLILTCGKRVTLRTVPLSCTTLRRANRHRAVGTPGGSAAGGLGRHRHHAPLRHRKSLCERQKGSLLRTRRLSKVGHSTIY